MHEPNWKVIFHEPVLSTRHINVGYDNANDIWEVRTEEGHYIVKIAKNGAQSHTIFWDGVYTLFGLNIESNIRRRQALARFVEEHSPLETPDVLRVDASKKRVDHPYIVATYLPGNPVDLGESPHARRLAYQLGDHLGSLHSVKHDYWGSFGETPRFEPTEWPLQVANTLEYMAEKWFADDEKVQEQLPDFVTQAHALPVPRSFTLVFPDLRPDQFLEHDGQLAALVDVESHVLGPRELDFIALEYSLQEDMVDPFIEGYERHLPLPELREARPLYRFLYLLIAAVTEASYDEWMNMPIRFD